MKYDLNQLDLEIYGPIMRPLSASLAHNYISRRAIILSGSRMLALMNHCNWLSSCSGLLLSLFACIRFWCSSSEMFPLFFHSLVVV